VPHFRNPPFGRSLRVREQARAVARRREFAVKASSRAAVGRIRYWWQARPMAGLLVGWIAIALIGWRVWAA
jgi:hypothetical protein